MFNASGSGIMKIKAHKKNRKHHYISSKENGKPGNMSINRTSQPSNSNENQARPRIQIMKIYTKKMKVEMIPRDKKKPELFSKEKRPELFAKEKRPELFAKEKRPELFAKEKRPELFAKEKRPELFAKEKRPELFAKEKRPELFAKEKRPELFAKEKRPELFAKEKRPELFAKEKRPELFPKEKRPEFFSKDKRPYMFSKEKTSGMFSKEKMPGMFSKEKKPEMSRKEKTPEIIPLERKPVIQPIKLTISSKPKTNKNKETEFVNVRIDQEVALSNETISYGIADLVKTKRRRCRDNTKSEDNHFSSPPLMLSPKKRKKKTVEVVEKKVKPVPVLTTAIPARSTSPKPKCNSPVPIIIPSYVIEYVTEQLKSMLEAEKAKNSISMDSDLEDAYLLEKECSEPFKFPENLSVEDLFRLYLGEDFTDLDDLNLELFKEVPDSMLSEANFEGKRTLTKFFYVPISNLSIGLAAVEYVDSESESGVDPKTGEELKVNVPVSNVDEESRMDVESESRSRHDSGDSNSSHDSGFESKPQSPNFEEEYTGVFVEHNYAKCTKTPIPAESKKIVTSHISKCHDYVIKNLAKLNFSENSKTQPNKRVPCVDSRNENFLRNKEHSKALFERRIVYLGNIPSSYTKEHLKEKFKRFGEIENIQIKSKLCDESDAADLKYLTIPSSKGNSSLWMSTQKGKEMKHFGFVTFKEIAVAREVVTKKDQLCTWPGGSIGFGGRREFVKEEYADFDSEASSFNSRGTYKRKQEGDVDYTLLLKMEQEKRGLIKPSLPKRPQFHA